VLHLAAGFKRIRDMQPISRWSLSTHCFGGSHILFCFVCCREEQTRASLADKLVQWIFPKIVIQHLFVFVLPP